MAAHWYCLINGREHGPFSSDKIQRLAKSGKLKREDSVRPETDRHWTPATAIPGLFPDASGHPVPPVAKAAPPKAAKKRATVPPQGKAPPPAPDQPIAVAASVPQAILLDGDRPAIPPAKPVAKPVATPVAAPVATPVAAPVAAPVGQSGAQPAVAVPSVVLPTAGAQSRGASELVHRGKRKSQQLYIVVGGLAASLIVLGGIAVFVLNRGPKEKKADVKVASPQAADAEPTDVDPETDPVSKAEAAQVSATTQQPVTLPSLTKWLDATVKQGGYRGIVKLGIRNVWLEPSGADGQLLCVTVDITNLQSDQHLDFKGWSGTAGRSAATSVVLADSSGNLLKQMAVGDAPDRVAKRSRRIAPGELLTQQLSFTIENTDSEHFRLALPYAALGYTRYLGFEIPRLMVQDRPPGADEEDFAVDGAAPPAEPGPSADQVQVDEGPRKTTENNGVQPDAKPDAAEAGEPKRQGGQPETISDLLRSIEDNSQDAADGQDPADGQDE